MKSRSKMVTVVAWVLATSSAPAQGPLMVNYQGRLLNGTNLVNATINIQFTLFDAETAGQAQYLEQDSNLPVVDGLYVTTLGDNPLIGDFPTVLTNQALWLELQINGQTLAPRERLAAVSYAIVASRVTNGAISELALADGAVTRAKLRDNAVSGEKIAGGTISNTHLAMAAVTGPKIAAGAVNPVNLNTPAFTNTFWMAQGNAGTPIAPLGDYFIGTVDNNGFDIRVNNSRAMRYRPDASSPLLIGGHVSNTVSASGSVIAGGGSDAAPQAIEGAYGFIGGGVGNRITNAIAATIGGGDRNLATGDYAAVLGGRNNRATGLGAAVPGGISNAALGSTSLAAGHRARAAHAGSFVWADSQNEDFGSAASNQFLIRAGRGLGLNVTNLAADIVLAGHPQLTTLVVAPGTNQPNYGSAQLMLAEDSRAAYGMLIQYDMANEQLRFYEKDWLATNGPRLVIDRRTSRVGVGATNLPDTLTVGGNIVPEVSNLHTLGTAALPWKKLHLGSEIGYQSDLGFVHDGVTVMNIGANQIVGLTNALYVRGDVHVGPQHVWTGSVHNSSLTFGDSEYTYIGERGHDDWMELRADRFYFKNGNVGIGTTNISAGVKLGVSGDIETSGDYEYTSARSGALNLPAPLFQYAWGSSDEIPSYDGGQFVYCSTAGAPTPPYLLYFVAPVHLPNGVTVTNMILYYYDNSSASNVALSAAFRRREMERTSYAQLSGYSTNSTENSTNVLATVGAAVLSGTVDNDAYMYSINISWQPDTTGNSLRFYGARLEYRTSVLRP